MFAEALPYRYKNHLLNMSQRSHLFIIRLHGIAISILLVHSILCNFSPEISLACAQNSATDSFIEADKFQIYSTTSYPPSQN
jgi:hypothetical protein